MLITVALKNEVFVERLVIVSGNWEWGLIPVLFATRGQRLFEAIRGSDTSSADFILVCVSLCLQVHCYHLRKVSTAKMSLPAHYQTAEGLRTLANYLRSQNGVKVRSGIEHEKRVEYFKGLYDH